ncbi:response regulator [Billgrantia desiderata]|uniref:Response regulator transcription factor n=1 Tax=Billgrantia desiderata TaxID=52021 RepID=A0AAW4YTA0_9GAMM|nr:response regulator transcription factor [Halomonas desiderata]MCE8051786.1 response regulator transcription factor [Halomonas desiderata]NIC36330.1 response regulator transcription factor [Halomonas desiderata]SEG00084.1 DNA-binding response regulator, NarL/FixJ family, contains REC and HTH domains [Halomonas desiderata]
MHDHAPSYRILIADDHPLFREAIARVVGDGFPGSELLETADLDATLAVTADEEDLDLILLDLNMPGMSGLTGLLQLRNEAPTIPVAIISAEEDKNVMLQAVSCGAVGFLTKSSPKEQLIKAIAQILEGNIYLPSEIMRASAARAHEPNERSISAEQLETLTRKQIQVLERMTRGESNKMIAYNLNIAETTVKAHVSAILRKLGVSNRVQAILSASDIDFSRYLRKP